MNEVWSRQARLCIALAFILSLLTACATSMPAPEPVISVDLGIEILELKAIDLDAVSTRLRVRIVNVGDTALVLSRLQVEVASGALDIVDPVSQDLGALSLEPGEETRLEAELCITIPGGVEPLVPLDVTATLDFMTKERGDESINVEYATDVPRILPPELRIASIHILKDELINTKLRVDLEVRNPNAFPVSFSTLDYRLYGEGRYWASDSIARPFEVLPMETTMARLYMTMNFTDMSRQLLDQVIRLATVRYRLVGQGSIDTGQEFLPQFVLPFDMSGQTEVLR